MRMRVDLSLFSESVMMCIACGDKSQRLPGFNFCCTTLPSICWSRIHWQRCGIVTRSSLTYVLLVSATGV